jgi:hypothetical protein
MARRSGGEGKFCSARHHTGSANEILLRKAIVTGQAARLTVPISAKLTLPPMRGIRTMEAYLSYFGDISVVRQSSTYHQQRPFAPDIRVSGG